MEMDLLEHWKDITEVGLEPKHIELKEKLNQTDLHAQISNGTFMEYDYFYHKSKKKT